MKPFFVHVDQWVNNGESTLEVCPLEVLLGIDEMDGCSSVSYFPGKQCIAIHGHVEAVGIDSLEQAIGWYAMRLHGSGRLRGKPLGYILPCINVSYGTGVIAPWVESSENLSVEP